jgi:hypothetical protein
MTLVLSGCGMKKLAVENADGLIYYQVGKRLPLYSEQKDDLGKDIDQFLNAKKNTANDVIAVINELDIKSEDKVEKHYKKLEAVYIETIRDFSNLLAKYIARLDKKQQKEFFEYLDDENREIVKRKKAQTIDKIEERAKMLLGSVNDKQKQLIREYEGYFHQRNKERVDRRIKFHTKLRSLFKEDLSVDSRTAGMQDAFRSYQAEALEGNKGLEILKKAVPTFTDEQKEHFRNHAQDMKEMLKYYLTVDY